MFQNGVHNQARVHMLIILLTTYTLQKLIGIRKFYARCFDCHHHHHPCERKKCEQTSIFIALHYYSAKDCSTFLLLHHCGQLQEALCVLLHGCYLNDQSFLQHLISTVSSPCGFCAGSFTHSLPWLTFVLSPYHRHPSFPSVSSLASI